MFLTTFKDPRNGEFDLSTLVVVHTALFCGGLAFDAYSKPP